MKVLNLVKKGLRSALNLVYGKYHLMNSHSYREFYEKRSI
ncbi:hypothetical protein DES37_104177 [Mangrovibacter plantisponsor]|uniref:Uncharacterized protein n=1 Tax=Mangrovibacter plantisponsor TaxID=451513 RepID=A0A317Q3L0_9ENTR|nr:hypothetical protein DES37_104177 [Mangrovibacter plantisponsor]